MMIQQILQEKKQLVDQYLAKLLATTEPATQTLYDSMNYSLLAGGKRIRPALFLMALDFLGKPSAAYLDAACAIECIHTYSLIHDDLPQMDNDDYRRGKLTNHKIYGAGMATMAGDGLLTYAFTLLSEMKSVTPDIRCQLIALLARAAGPEGMVGGQAQDIEAEHHQLTMNALRTLDYYKTGRLLCVPLDMASAAANAEHETADAFHVYGLHIGYLFQITDDLLDATGSLEEMGKNPGQDQIHNKATYASLAGLDGARKLAQEECDKAVHAVAQLGKRAEPFQELAMYLLHRTK